MWLFYINFTDRSFTGFKDGMRCLSEMSQCVIEMVEPLNLLKFVLFVLFTAKKTEYSIWNVVQCNN